MGQPGGVTHPEVVLKEGPLSASGYERNLTDVPRREAL